MKKYFRSIMILFCVVIFKHALADDRSKLRPGKAHLSFELITAGENDTLAVKVFRKPLVLGNDDEAIIYKAVANESGKFTFEFEADQQGSYFSLQLLHWLGSKTDSTGIDKVISEGNLAEPGDNVSISYRPKSGQRDRQVFAEYQVTIKGQGAGKYLCKQKLDSLQLVLVRSSCFLPDGTYNSNNVNVKVIKEGLAILDEAKTNILGAILKNMGTDWVARRYELELIAIRKKLEVMPEEQRLNFYRHISVLDSSFHALVPGDLSNSFNSAMTLIRLASLQANLAQPSEDRTFEAVRDQNNGALRDRLICALFRSGGYRFLDYNRIFDEAAKAVRTPFYADYLSKFKSRKTGEPAFDFHLQDTKGRFVNFHDFAGKVVILDFWFTGCPSCSRFYKQQLSKVEQHFATDGRVAFVTINIDRNKEMWLTSVHKGTYTSQDVVNLNTGPEGMGNSAIEHYKVMSYPQPMIVNPEGNVALFGNAETLTADDLISVIKMELAIKN